MAQEVEWIQESPKETATFVTWNFGILHINHATKAQQQVEAHFTFKAQQQASKSMWTFISAICSQPCKRINHASIAQPICISKRFGILCINQASDHYARLFSRFATELNLLMFCD